jgi:hypothetical protein
LSCGGCGPICVGRAAIVAADLDSGNLAFEITAFVVMDQLTERRLVELREHIGERLAWLLACRKQRPVDFLRSVAMSVLPCFRLISPFLSR